MNKELLISVVNKMENREQRIEFLKTCVKWSVKFYEKNATYGHEAFHHHLAKEYLASNLNLFNF